MSIVSVKDCRDGSETLYSEQFREHYHNPNGAITESRYVFIEKTGAEKHLIHYPETHIFELGFGTGLNFALMADLALQHEDSGHLVYHSVEAFPIDDNTSGSLDYGRFLQNREISRWLQDIFRNLTPGWNSLILSDNIQLDIFYGLFDECHLTDSFADIIFFDAFSPQANPDLWSGKVFQVLKKGSNPDVILSTYCAASSARAAMAWAGWSVARVPGVLGKREMSLAALNPDLLTPYKRVNEKRLAERYELGEFRR